MVCIIRDGGLRVAQMPTHRKGRDEWGARCMGHPPRGWDSDRAAGMVASDGWILSHNAMDLARDSWATRPVYASQPSQAGACRRAGRLAVVQFQALCHRTSRTGRDRIRLDGSEERSCGWWNPRLRSETWGTQRGGSLTDLGPPATQHPEFGLVRQIWATRPRCLCLCSSARVLG